jgi:DNA polymerase-1
MAKRAAKNHPMLVGFEELFAVEPVAEPVAEIAAEEERLPSSSLESNSASDPQHNDSSNATSATARHNHPFPVAGDLVILVDSHSLIYQVFHALPAMTSPQGVEVGAAHGFLRDIANLLEQWKPDFLICTFDFSGTTFRNEL